MRPLPPSILTSTADALNFAEVISQRRITLPDEWYIPHKHGQEQFHKATQPIRGLFPGNGFGKGLRHGEKVLTPTGWLNIENVKVGDSVIGSDGRPTEVLGVYPQGGLPILRVEFNDNTSLHVDPEHLWTVQLRDNRFLRPEHPERLGQWQTIQTQEMVKRFGHVPKPSSRACIPSVAPAQFPGRIVPLDPYLLGLLLGNACLTQRATVMFSTADKELVDEIARWFPIRFVSRYDYRIRGLHPTLQRMGLMGKRSNTKFVPAAYLWNDVATRRAVLAGLLDTDGSARENQHEFCSTSEQLADDVVFLARSLGGITTKSGPRRTKYTYKGERRIGLPSWRVHLWMPECPFRLARKAARWRAIETNPGRMVRSIKPAGTAEVTCIRVAAADGLFVATDFIVTHNTRAAGAEVNAWVTHSNRWQRTPPWPVICLWVCQDNRQFDLLRLDLEADCFTRTWTFHHDPAPHYRWPDGSRLYIFSAERSWTTVQGINPDLVLFDEEPPHLLWREMMMRRRGKRSTKFIVAATATRGITWMHAEIYQPWMALHKALGIDEDRAMLRQLHPDIWVWAKGGIDDNPGASEADRQWYRGRTWASENERQVRLFGGFRSWVGDPVFDERAIADLVAAADEADRDMGVGRLGSFEVLEDRR